MHAPYMGRGRSSGVEHNLAKVGVVSSNLIARSKIFKYNIYITELLYGGSRYLRPSGSDWGSGNGAGNP